MDICAQKIIKYIEKTMKNNEPQKKTKKNHEWKKREELSRKKKKQEKLEETGRNGK